MSTRVGSLETPVPVVERPRAERPIVKRLVVERGV
jgi:hypothetical protein